MCQSTATGGQIERHPTSVRGDIDHAQTAMRTLAAYPVFIVFQAKQFIRARITATFWFSFYSFLTNIFSFLLQRDAL